MEVLGVICKRMCVQLQEDISDAPMSDPLLWMVHGGPGTGKSEVLKLVKKLFLEVCGWQIGLDYQVVALQAVTAQLLDGDTVHHACGINPFGASSGAKASQRAAQRKATVAERVGQWKWLLIDEFGMISPKLFAELDMKLRADVSARNRTKIGSTGDALPFGGLNSVMFGASINWILPRVDLWDRFRSTSSRKHANTTPSRTLRTGSRSFGAKAKAACRA